MPIRLRATARPSSSSAARSVAAALLLSVAACGRPLQPIVPRPTVPAVRTQIAAPSPIAREFRGVWVATVSNIDWPSRPGLSTAQQQAELIAILDRARALNLNAVVFQVRPAADALYRSDLEPWSEYLTGEQGRAPDPMWDPLAFAVEQAHARGLELHAWFNPYRARYAGAKGPAAATHVSRTKPQIVRQYARWLWMDPGEPGTLDHSIAVVRDVVRRYDIDGVHIDDYFYPYKEKDAAGRTIDFPDSASYAAYVQRGGTLGRDDWRRSNVDAFVQRMFETVRREKPWVKVGISPFGIWRPQNPAGICCFDAYQELYADARNWLRQGWVDYFTPQLYWQISAPQQSYPRLLEWWKGENVHARHLWPGNYSGRVGVGATPWPAAEIDSQIAVTRRLVPEGGNVFFSMKAFMTNQGGLADSLRLGPYAEPALVPATPWLPGRVPGAPHVALRADSAPGAVAVSLGAAPGEGRPFVFVVRARYADRWTTYVVPGAAATFTLRQPATRGAVDEVRVSAVDRTGREGAATAIVPVGGVRAAGGGER